MSLGTNLQYLRRLSLNMTQEDLAEKLGVSRQTVSKWEKGLSVPDAELLTKLAEVLNVSVSDLLGKKIEIPEGKNEKDVLALELAKLNELLIVYGNNFSNLMKKIGIAVGIIVFLLCVGSIYDSWSDMWHEFGQNLYHVFND